MDRILVFGLIAAIFTTQLVGCNQEYRQPTFKDGQKIVILNSKDEVVAEITDQKEIKQITKSFRESKSISTSFANKPALPGNLQEWLKTKVYKVRFYNKNISEPEGVAIDNDFNFFWFGPYYYRPSDELKKALSPYIK
ncbi:MAG: hypothetical protein M0021_16775 [Clostridia bacterium]|nr:hypothetical protein [Clostridia bacterium]